MTPSTRDTLMAAAAELLDEGGLEAVTLREVGRRAGVSHNAPYKHFADKEALLAAVAARELTNQGAALAAALRQDPSPETILRSALRGYVAWALAHPARFKLVFGFWSTNSAELAAAADSTRTMLIDVVAAAQRAGWLPAGDPERLTALLQAVTQGAVDLAISGHLEAQGKGHASPDDLVDDLLDHLRASARVTSRV
ncbi:TetR/AcrR family transcriptional regulator [Allostreptomyces psammosilenae]|uniref:AcrR family transcriptional regulator n=1 Tax=Allostreptomyces psammosilenae TaxID=1892865 RepID=A0A852ZNI0_9ACTN|nr:TetR/AcrR family transcriptional regulator [Allostreptomyces psammosilenae]NYI04006.1 AcrR family transcriptional regulator [Allostreptomyces psammosilenae]